MRGSKGKQMLNAMRGKNGRLNSRGWKAINETSQITFPIQGHPFSIHKPSQMSGRKERKALVLKY